MYRGNTPPHAHTHVQTRVVKKDPGSFSHEHEKRNRSFILVDQKKNQSYFPCQEVFNSSRQWSRGGSARLHKLKNLNVRSLAKKTHKQNKRRKKYFKKTKKTSNSFPL